MSVPTADLTSPPASAVDVLRSYANSEAAEAAESFLRHKRGKQKAQVSARQMGLISRSLADREEQRRGLLDAARARATTQTRVFVKPPRLDQPVVCLRMGATDTVKELTAAAESRCGLKLGTTRLAWGGKVVSSSDAVSQYNTSSLEPFRLLPAVPTASKSRIYALATPSNSRESKLDPAAERPKRVPPPTAAAPSPRLLELSTPRTVTPTPTAEVREQCTSGTSNRRIRTRPCTPRLHALAQPARARQTVSQRAVASNSGQECSPEPESLDGGESQAAAVAVLDAASSTACSAVEESAVLSFIHEAVALAKALMAEGRRRDLSSEQRHTCYADAVDSLLQAVDVANETQVLGTEELEQLTRMLELAEKHACLSL